MDQKTILAAVDHTLLRQTATHDEIRALCEDAAAYGTASVCVPPAFVAFAKEVLRGRTKVCTVIGFPNGNSTSEAKAFETRDAVKNGADEIDMVANLSLVREGDWSGVKSDIAAVRAACPGKVLKVIVETCLLTETEQEILPSVVADAGADYIKTSTGFSTGGATFEDVALWKKIAPPGLKIKAAGGISSLADAERFLELGADRLGTSRIVKLAIEQGYDPDAPTA